VINIQTGNNVNSCLDTAICNKKGRKEERKKGRQTDRK
jgi:hypothetical protein